MVLFEHSLVSFSLSWFSGIVLSNGRSFISVKGVPDFWLTAMKTNEILAAEVRTFTLYKSL